MLYFLIAILIVLFWVAKKRYLKDGLSPAVVQKNSLDDGQDLKCIEKHVLQDRKVEGLKAGNEKFIHWADKKQKTSHAILYLHGLGASPQEISPVTEQLSSQLGVNAYFARFAGHGLTNGSAMSGCSAEDWLQDAWDAWQVAAVLGEKIIVVATSTGATIAEWLIAQDDVKKSVAGIVYMSPNFGIVSPISPILSWPFSSSWLPFILGEKHTAQPDNNLQEQYWTQSYPVGVLREMQRLIDWVVQNNNNSSEELMVIYSRKDRVVSAAKTRRYLRGRKCNINWLQLSGLENSNHHVLAGDAVMPKNNEYVIRAVLEYLSQRIEPT